MKSKGKGGGRARIRILVLHGPNLQLLGTREPDVYGKVTMAQINGELRRVAGSLGCMLRIVQSNHEGRIVDLIGRASSRYEGILINPAAYTHTSVAIRDALLACNVPSVEVHLSNIARREEFRQKSLTAAACVGQVSGFGKDSYRLGLLALVGVLQGR